MNKTDYNGWTNKETWLVNVHYGDCFIVKEFIESSPNQYELEKTLKDHFILDNDEEIKSSFGRDMYRSALQNVNWRELAEHYWQDRESNCNAK